MTHEAGAQHDISVRRLGTLDAGPCHMLHDASLRVQGGGLREGLLALQQQADPQRHLVRPAVLAPVVALVRGVAACPEAACLAATLLRGLATAGPSERAGIWCVSTLRPPCLD